MSFLKFSNVRSATLIHRLETDLQMISQYLKKIDTQPQFVKSMAEELASELGLINQLSAQLNQNDQVRARQLQRYLFTLIDRHFETLVNSSSTRIQKQDLRGVVAKGFDVFGVVPKLNASVVLPSQQFLPKNMEQTKVLWQKTKCVNPSRTAKTIATGRLTFLTRAGKNSVRAALLEEVQNKRLSSIKHGPVEQYLNLMDKEYYKLELLHADHLLPCVNLVGRIKEMIEYMNLDPSFRDDMLKSEFNDSYFIEDRQGNVIGTYWLYASHYNAMQNLWFLLASDNSGGGKIFLDPIDWLKGSNVGKEYLAYLRDAGRVVNTSGLFYTVTPGQESLRDSFIKWIEGNHQRLIKFCQLFSQFHIEAREQAELVTGSKKRSRSTTEVAVRLTSTVHSLFHKDSDESSISSVDIEIQDDIRDAVRVKLDNSSKYQFLSKQIGKIERDTIREVKKNQS